MSAVANAGAGVKYCITMIEKTVRRARMFTGRLLNLEVLEVELEPGRVARRELVIHPGAAVIIAQLPDGRYVFVRQFRKAIERELLEAVAGTLAPGEDPTACAARELREETGYRHRKLQKLGIIYPAPGYSTEILHVFYALLDPEREAVDPDEDEKLTVVLVTGERFEKMIAAGQVEDSKTLAAWLLFRSGADSLEKRAEPRPVTF